MASSSILLLLLPHHLHTNHNHLLQTTRSSSRFGFPILKAKIPNRKSRRRGTLSGRISCFFNSKEPRESENHTQNQDGKSNWPVLKRWDVPWEWQTLSLTMFASGLSFALVGLVENSVTPYLGIDIDSLSLDGKAELLLVYQLTASAAVLGVIFGITSRFKPFPDEIFSYSLKNPFNIKDGWLLWAMIGLGSAVGLIALYGTVQAAVNGQPPQRETDALVRLLPLIGSSTVSTACLLGITGILAPVLEETVFRGFLMVSMTKWFPTPVAILLSSAAFSLAHFTPGEFPQLFVLGLTLGLSYAQTRSLLTPITIHALWNSGVILLLSFLQLQGYDIKELLQAQ